MPVALRGYVRTFAGVAVAFAVLFAAGFLPPDTSLSQVERYGRLTICVPDRLPPMVTGEIEAPGFDIELLEAVASRLGWRLTVATRPAIGRSLNPRGWNITRAQCQILAGGVVLSQTTRSFLSVSDPTLLSSWALLTKGERALEDIAGPVGVFATGTGLDRLELGQYLRANGISAVPISDPSTIETALSDGTIDAAITELLFAGQFEGSGEIQIQPLADQLPTFSFGLGFWKGDETLKRAVLATIDQLRADGTVTAIAERYDIPDQAVCRSQETCSRP